MRRLAVLRVYETTMEGCRVQHTLYLEPLPGPLKRYSAMHEAGSVYRSTLGLSSDGHWLLKLVELGFFPSKLT